MTTMPRAIVIDIIQELSNSIAKLAVREIAPESLGTESDEELLSLHRRLHQLFAGNFEGTDITSTDGLTREDLINAEIFTQDEMTARDFEHKADDGLTEEAAMLRALANRKLAPVHPSGDHMGPLIKIGDVLPHLKPFKIRSPGIFLVGGLACHGQTRGDIDILIKGPLDDETRRVIEFRIGRMLPPELSNRVQFLSDDSGPFTDYVELADFEVRMRGGYKRKEMRLEISEQEICEILKQGDPLKQLPPSRARRPTPAVLQAHSRGKSVHLDFRFKVDGNLAGWTVPAQKAGRIREPIETIPQGRRLARDFKPEGSFFWKSLFDGVVATAKKAQPLVWLKLGDKKFAEGEVGATRFEPGVFVAIEEWKGGADGGVEFGMQGNNFHEYFITKGKKLNGILNFRRLEGRGGPTQEIEEGRATPEGQMFWRTFLSKQLLPSVLERRSVREGRMPEDGGSALPKTLEDITPTEFRYWKATGAGARKLRDALVDSRFFTAKNVKIVDGQFRRVDEVKSFFYVNKRLGLGLDAEAGVHVHALDRTNATTRLDGEHVHLYRLPDGIMLATQEDGAHTHAMGDGTDNSIEDSGEHNHVLTLPTGQQLVTSMNGEHRHDTQVVTTAFDGMHVHTVTLPDDQTLTSLEPGDFWGLIGKPDQSNNPPVPSAQLLAKFETRILKLAGVDAEQLPGMLEPIYQSDGFDFARDNPFVKEGEQRMTIGINLEPETKDLQDDIYSAEEVRAAAERSSKQVGLMHDGIIDNRAKLMGHYIAKSTFSIGDEVVKADTWLSIIFVMDKALWKKVENGELTGLSIGGEARRERVA